MRSSEPNPLVESTESTESTEMSEAAPPRGTPAGATLTLVGSESAAEPAEGAAAPRWNLAKRILFRFAFAYLLLYNLPFPLDFLAYFSIDITSPYQKIWDFVVPAVAEDVFQADASVRPNGSGDTTYNYVQLFCFLVVALAATAIWTFLDRRRPNYVRLHEGLRVYIRYALAITMLSYGAIKVIPSQFPSPTLDRLLQPFGDASPMGLLWTFMGSSDAYSAFAGASEMLGGLLLFTRRTTLLGALVSIGVMTNVVMLNFCYDVPVKLFSSHLLVMAVFLALPDLRRLADLLVFNRRVEPAPIRPLFARKWLDQGAIVLRSAAAVGLTAFLLYQAQAGVREYGDLAPKSPLYGIWDVEEFVFDGQARPPLVTDDTRWRRVVFDNPLMIAFYNMAGERQRFLLMLNSDTHMLTLKKRDDPKWRSALSYRELGPRLLAIEGRFDGHKIQARLRRIDERSFLLVSRGFHWINEYPYNR